MSMWPWPRRRSAVILVKNGPGGKTPPGRGRGGNGGKGNQGHGGGLPLTDHLVSYWKMEEASGNRADSVGSNTLVDNNTCGQRAGKLSNAVDFIRANSEYLSIATNASLLYTNGLTVTGWVLFDSLATDSSVIGKWGTLNHSEWFFDAAGASNAFRLYTTTNGQSGTQTVLTSARLATTGAWTFFAIRFTQQVGSSLQQLKINGLAWESVSTAAGARVFNGNSPLRMGSRDVSGSLYMDGGLDNVTWHDRVLSDGDVDQIYNGGAGLVLL